MAREVITQVRITDDLDGSEGAETFHFSYQGKSYEIDLNPKNAEKYDKIFQTLIASARRSGAVPSVIKGAKQQRDFDIVELREWAGRNNIDLPVRGRIPLAIVEQFRASLGQ